MAKVDPERVDKWAAREAEWYWLADVANDPHVASTCTKLAEQAGEMKRFWGG